MQSSKLRAYQIGLAVIGIFSIVLCVFVLSRAALAGQDSRTQKAAQSAADKLNEYTTSKSSVPESLQQVGVKNAPESITYKKLSSTQYRFCVTYKTTSSGFDASTALTDIAMGGLADGATSGDYSNSDQSYLDVPTTHKKGQTCQTITPYQYGANYTPFNGGPSSSVFNSFSSNQSTARDAERQVDINSLDSQLEAFYAQNGVYPLFTEVNNATWRQTNMPGLDPEALRDPQGSSAQLVAAPTKNAYSYQVTGDGGVACENEAVDCTGFTLTAQLESGAPYTKKSF